MSRRTLCLETDGWLPISHFPLLHYIFLMGVAGGAAETVFNQDIDATNPQSLQIV